MYDVKNFTVRQFISVETDLIRCLLISVTNQKGFMLYCREDVYMHYKFCLSHSRNYNQELQVVLKAFSNYQML